MSIDSVTFCFQIAEVNGQHAEAALMQAYMHLWTYALMRAYVCISAASAC